MLRDLYNEQEGIFPIKLSEHSKYFFKEIYPSNFNYLSVQEDIKKINDLPEFDKSIFAEWEKWDLPIMFISGILGTFSSVMLKDIFSEKHDKIFSKKSALNGGHSGELIDRVPGHKQAGGFGHRWLFGHDILNPFEVDWKQYVEIAKESGSPLPNWLMAGWYWYRHVVLQDRFSIEGRPLAGHSYFRDFLDPEKNQEILRYIGTLKRRDMAGAAVTNLIMGAYLWGTEKDIKRVIIKANYRAFSLMLGANYLTLLSGLLVPNKHDISLNWHAMRVISYYLLRLILLEQKVQKEIKNRELILNTNDDILKYNELKALSIDFNNKYYKELKIYECDVDEYFNQTMDKHRQLIKEF